MHSIWISSWAENDSFGSKINCRGQTEEELGTPLGDAGEGRGAISAIFRRLARKENFIPKSRRLHLEFAKS